MDADHDRKDGRPPGNGAVWSLVLPPVERLLCHADAPPALAIEAARRGVRVDVVTRCDLESWQQAAGGEPRLRCVWEPDPQVEYDLALLWDPHDDHEVRAWLSALARLPLPPREVAVRCLRRRRWSGLTWSAVDWRLRRAGWRPGAAHLPLPEADRVRQLVGWDEYARTPLVRHRRSHRRWKAWLTRQPFWRWVLPARLRRATLRGVDPSGSLLDHVLVDAGRTLGGAVELERLLVSPNGVAIGSVRQRTCADDRNAILKVPYALVAEGRVARNADALEWLAVRARELGPWAGTPPRLLARGTTRGWTWTLEECARGSDAQAWSDADAEGAMRQLVEFLGALARLGEPARPLDGATLDRACDAPARRVAALLEPAPAGRLKSLAAQLHHQLAGVPVPRVVRHGDFKLENVLGVPSEPASLRILDWELWSPQGLPMLDLWHLLVSRRARAAGQALGTTIARWLLPGTLSAAERSLVEHASAGLDRRYVSVSPLLYWLDRIGPVAARGSWPARGWARANVLGVLDVAERFAAEIDVCLQEPREVQR